MNYYFFEGLKLGFRNGLAASKFSVPVFVSLYYRIKECKESTNGN